MWEHHYEAGQSHLKNQDYDLAILHFQSALNHAPEVPLIHTALIETYLHQGDFEEAFEHLQTCLQSAPQHTAYLQLLGDLYMAQESYTQALYTYRSALASGPQDVETILRATEASLCLHQLDTALTLIDEGLTLSAQHVDLHLLRARVLFLKGQPKMAAEICEQLYQVYPDRLDIISQWLKYLSTDSPHEALAFLIALAQQKPEQQGFLATQAANLQRSIGDVEEAKQSLRLALQDPGLSQRVAYQLLLNLMHPMIPQNEAEMHAYRQQLQHWSNTLNNLEPSKLSFQETPLTPYFKILSLLSFLPYLNINPLAARKAYGTFLQNSLPSRSPLLAAAHQTPPHLVFVLHNNSPVFQFIQGLLVHWPKRWKITVASISSDAYERTFEQSLKSQRPDFEYLQLSSAPEQALKQLEALQAQIIFYTEVYADTALQTFLASQRLAPIQVTSWLSSGSSGLNTLDYFISPRSAEQSQAQEAYSEQLVLTEHLPAYIHPPVFTSAIPQRSDYGLPEDKTLYLCSHLLHKLSPDFDFALAGILEKDPQGIVILQARPAIENIHRRMLQRLENQVPHCMDRIWFVPVMEQPDFYGLMHIADVFLDPFHFGGGTTSFEALAFNLPIITWPGERLHGRISYAYYQHMGVFDAIAMSPEDYIEKAVTIASQPAVNKALREKIAQNKHKLFQQEAAVLELSQHLYALLTKKPDQASSLDAQPSLKTSSPPEPGK